MFQERFWVSWKDSIYKGKCGTANKWKRGKSVSNQKNKLLQKI